jgi:hypothetical protein
MKARFKAAQLLPKQLLAGWKIAEDFNQSSRSFDVQPRQQFEQKCLNGFTACDGEDHRMALPMSEMRFPCALRDGPFKDRRHRNHGRTQHASLTELSLERLRT